MKITEEFVETMICPACGGRMQLNASADAIKCRACRRVYQIKDDIPDMLVEHATIEAETRTPAS
ncbi:MAG TPA: Trm112 family protein [Pyrinomonadaceae bacterium]|nr:Trm112 family protein [Pyrinomonadaceae bacterium]